MSLLDSQEVIEQKIEPSFPITEDWLKEIGMCWYERDITRRDIITPGFAWTPIHNNHLKFKGWSIKYDISTEKWILMRIEPIDDKFCHERYIHYYIKCRKEFIDFISNCEEI